MIKMNLYMVTDSNYEWCCFVFDTSRNRAKLWVSNHFDESYISLRCKTLRKGINLSQPMLIDDPASEGYNLVLECGYRFATEDEVN